MPGGNLTVDSWKVWGRREAGEGRSLLPRSRCSPQMLCFSASIEPCTGGRGETWAWKSEDFGVCSYLNPQHTVVTLEAHLLGLRHELNRVSCPPGQRPSITQRTCTNQVPRVTGHSEPARPPSREPWAPAIVCPVPGGLRKSGRCGPLELRALQPQSPLH